MSTVSYGIVCIPSLHSYKILHPSEISLSAYSIKEFISDNMSCSQRGLQTGFQETDFHQTGFIEDDFSQGGFGYGDHSYKAEWARQLVLARLAEFYQTRPDKDPMRDEITIPPSEKITPEHLPQLREVPTRAAEADEYRVCIIGAGVAGLFTAMIIDYLNGKANLGFTYDIFEAASETRFGGRLYTHRFSHALHDYYDIGAMRFPKIPIMERYVPTRAGSARMADRVANPS